MNALTIIVIHKNLIQKFKRIETTKERCNLYIKYAQITVN